MWLRFWTSKGIKSEHFINNHMYQQLHDRDFRTFLLKVINLNMEQNKTKVHLNNLIGNNPVSLWVCAWYEWKSIVDKHF